MSLEQLKVFLEKVKGDISLQEKLKAAKSPEDVVGIAKEQGYEFTADKINQLSDDELENVAWGVNSAGARTCPSWCCPSAHPCVTNSWCPDGDFCNN